MTMQLKIGYDPENISGYLSISDDFPNYIWNEIKNHVISIQADANFQGRIVFTDWMTILSIAPQIGKLRNQYGFKIEYDEISKSLLGKYQEEYKAIRSLSGMLKMNLLEDEIKTCLYEQGFTKRLLTPFQMRDLMQLISLPNGANFSVPGAGKTTVAFALHLLLKRSFSKDNIFLLVVAPKNAFQAWEDVITDCLDQSSSDFQIDKFSRLVGGYDNIGTLLSLKSPYMIISYDQFIRVKELIGRFMSLNRVHIVLDESHRMKAGERSQRGASLLSISHLATRRDILSGTPIPRSLEDITSQIDFVWPGQGLGRKIVESSTPQKMLAGLFARTTKQELGLPPTTRNFIQVHMSSPQLALYSIIRNELLKRLGGIKLSSSIDLLSAKKSVIRLLQVSSNPILAVKSMTGDTPDTYWYDDPTIEAIFDAIVAELDSPKLMRACEIARELVSKDQHVVIWSSFTSNVERMSELLEDCGAAFIHGNVPTGSDDDPNTREGIIKRFHDKDSGCKVLIANPAACSEGISLHKICHHAIYLDRTFNAAHYLQSVDRIHRLGLSSNIETHIHILESVAPNVIGAIDYSVRRRLIEKLRIMAQALNDTDIQSLAFDEEDGDQPLDFDITLDDLKDLLDELTNNSSPMPEEEE